MDLQTEWGELLRCVISIGLIALSILLNRRILAFFGALGILYYLFHLSGLFHNWVLFPFLITALGALIIALGVYRNNVTNEEMTRMLQQETTPEDQTGTLALVEQEHFAEPSLSDSREPTIMNDRDNREGNGEIQEVVVPATPGEVV